MFTQDQINAIAAAITAALQGLVSAPAPVAPPPPPPPPVDPRVAAIERLEAQIAALRDPAVASPAPAPAPVAPQPAPAPASGVTWTADAHGRRIDDVALPGTPGTVTLGRTGHVLSLPQPGPVYGKGEMWNAYCARVHRQCGASNDNAAGARMQAGDGHFRDIGGFMTNGANWPLGADKWFNAKAYLTDAQKKQAADAAAREAAHADGTWASMDDAYKARAGGSTPPPPSVAVDVPIGS